MTDISCFWTLPASKCFISYCASCIFTTDLQDVRLALALLRFWSTFSIRFYASNVSFSWWSSCGEGGTKTVINIFLLMKNAPRNDTYMAKQQIFHIFTLTHNHAQDTKSVHHSIMCLKPQVFTSILGAKWSAPHWQCTPLKKWLPRASATNTKIATTVGLPQSTTKRWLCHSKTQRKTRH